MMKMIKTEKNPFAKKISILLALTVLLSCFSIPTFAATYYVVHVPEGDYYLCASSNQNYAISVMGSSTAQGTYLHLWQQINGNPDQIVHVKHISGDWYKLEMKNTSLCINVPGGNNANGQQLWTWPWDGTDSCLVRFLSAGDGSYIIQNKMGRCIDLDNNLVFNGSRLHLWDLHGGASERWFLKPVTDTATQSTAKAKLDQIMNGSLSIDSKTVMALNRTFTGTRSSEQCKGYARNVFLLLWNVNPGSTQSSPYNYRLYSQAGMREVASTANLTSDRARNLFSQGNDLIGSFVQMRRSHGGSHSAIVYEVSNYGVTFLEANTDGRNTIRKNTYTWAQLATKNAAMSVYMAAR